MSSWSSREMELERACGWVVRVERLCFEGRSGGTGLRGGSTGRSSKQEVKEEVDVDEGEGGGRQICRWGPKGARGMGSGEDGRERPVAMGTCSFTITYIYRDKRKHQHGKHKKLKTTCNKTSCTSRCSSWKRSADCDSLLLAIAALGVAAVSSVNLL